MINSTGEDRTILLLRFWHPGLDGDRGRREALSGAIRAKEEGVRARWFPPE